VRHGERDLDGIARDVNIGDGDQVAVAGREDERAVFRDILGGRD